MLKFRISTSFSAPWGRAIAVAVFVHVGALSALALGPRLLDSSTEELGVDNAIEISTALSIVAADATPEASDVANEDRVATPSVTEIRSQKQTVDLPTEQVSPEAPEDPTLQMAQEQTREKEETPQEEVKQASEAAQQQEASTSSRASVAAEQATPQAGEESEEKSTAPDVGSSREAESRISAWHRQLFKHIAKYKAYPEVARSRKIKGEALLAFSLDAAGNVSNVKVERSSGSPILDEAAADVMRRASPLPRPPGGAQKSWNLTMPMRFQLK